MVDLASFKPDQVLANEIVLVWRSPADCGKRHHPKHIPKNCGFQLGDFNDVYDVYGSIF